MRQAKLARAGSTISRQSGYTAGDADGDPVATGATYEIGPAAFNPGNLVLLDLWGCLGGWLAIAPTATGTYFGTCDYPRCYGVVFLAYGAGAIAGPQLAGFIKTSTGNYLGVFPYVMVLALIGIGVAWNMLKPPGKVQET